MFAFFIWNLDNLLCVPSTRLKEKIGIPWAWALEGHGHWHIFTSVISLGPSRISADTRPCSEGSGFIP